MAILARMHANIEHATGMAENNSNKISAGILPRAEERIADLEQELAAIKAKLEIRTRDRFYRSDGDALIRRIEKLEDRLVDHGHNGTPYEPFPNRGRVSP